MPNFVEPAADPFYDSSTEDNLAVPPRTQFEINQQMALTAGQNMRYILDHLIFYPIKEFFDSLPEPGPPPMGNPTVYPYPQPTPSGPPPPKWPAPTADFSIRTGVGGTPGGASGAGWIFGGTQIWGIEPWGVGPGRVLLGRESEDFVKKHGKKHG